MTNTSQAFSRDAIRLDTAAEAERIAGTIRTTVFRRLKRRGVVLGVSGGIDSSVCAALCVRALGAERVTALLMPEADSAPETTDLGSILAQHLGVRAVLEEITPILDAVSCYARRDAAIREVVPAYTLSANRKSCCRTCSTATATASSRWSSSFPTARSRARLTSDAYLGILAATNFKQRVRKMMEYHWADRLQCAVVGTPNRLEYDQGFFVKLGDGAADLKPIGHLYKSQVYQLAEYLDIPAKIRQRPPTTDTYSLSQSQEEFYFSVPLETLDLCLFGMNHGIDVREVAGAVGLSVAQVERVYRDIAAKRRAAAYLHASPTLLEEVRH